MFNYFEDPPYGHKIRASGTTGEERAKTFDGTLGELDYFIRDKKYSDAASRKRERQREAAEAARAADRREPAAVQGAAPRIATWLSAEKDDQPAGAGDNARESGAADGPVRLDTDLQGELAVEGEGNDYRAYIASEFVDLCGHDVRQAVAYLIDRRWNRADALEWLTAWAGKGTSRPEAA